MPGYVYSQTCKPIFVMARNEQPYNVLTKGAPHRTNTYHLGETPILIKKNANITTDLHIAQHVRVTWFLVLEDATSSSSGELRHPVGMDPQPPSSRLPPFGAIEDLRFPWGSHAPIKVFAPERSTVSLWARVVSPGGELRQVAGRLAGYTQHGRSVAAYENVARGL